MRFQSGERFQSFQDDAATASIALTSTIRGIVIDTVIGWSTGSSPIVTIQASGTTLWRGIGNSAGMPVEFTDLWIEGNGATLSANISGATSATITIVGTYRTL
jgi:hypothetical protein